MPRPRKAQVGTGERAEKIRTYNYAESRVTDHRIKLTQHRLDQVLDGELAEFTEASSPRTAAARSKPPSAMTLGEVLAALDGVPRAKGVESPRLDAERLLAPALGLTRIELYTRSTAR